jgi:3-methyladenine DNA glycosylase/8-oxoguanine DNA glycosylase
VPWRFDVACCAVLQQRVTVREAWQEWTRIAKRYGTRAGELLAFPSAETIARMDSWRFEELGVDPKRTRAMTGLARDVVRRGTFGWIDHARVRKHMRAVRGIGVWTTEMTMGFGYGDPDALPLADLHLPHLVTWALARERPGTDERMAELLEPYRGQRFRAVRLLLDAGIVVPRA